MFTHTHTQHKGVMGELAGVHRPLPLPGPMPSLGQLGGLKDIPWEGLLKRNHCDYLLPLLTAAQASIQWVNSLNEVGDAADQNAENSLTQDRERQVLPLTGAEWGKACDKVTSEDNVEAGGWKEKWVWTRLDLSPKVSLPRHMLPLTLSHTEILELHS